MKGDEAMKTLTVKAKRAYEWARFKRALVHATPSLAFLILLMFEGATPVRLVLAVALYVSAVFALMIGQGAEEAVLPSLVYGVVPFAIVRIAESSGHVCMGEACMSWCLPACIAGGLAGGALVGLRGARAKRPAWLPSRLDDTRLLGGRDGLPMCRQRGPFGDGLGGADGRCSTHCSASDVGAAVM